MHVEKKKLLFTVEGVTEVRQYLPRIPPASGLRIPSTGVSLIEEREMREILRKK